MPSGKDDFDDSDDLLIFPLIDLDGDSNNNDTEEDDFDSDSPGSGPCVNTYNGRFRPLMTLKQRRRSLLSVTGLQIPAHLTLNVNIKREDSGIDVHSLSPIARWKKAVKKIRTLQDPWEQFHLDQLPAERATRHRYNALKRQWVVDEVVVKMEIEPFNHGAMRACYRLKKLTSENAKDWKKQASNYVAKCYMENVSRDVYFEDVHLQMDAKLWGEEFNRHRPPKKVDILQMSILEFKQRPGCPLFHLEHFIDGTYIKYNSNSGFVEENLRLTPQAFSHFTFERSSHKMIVVDIQGVGDLWTDPQIHTADGICYGDGNLGAKGMALFFHSHICNSICESLRLSKFDLAASEISSQKDFIRMQVNAMTRVRGVEEVCNGSPVECADFMSYFHRTRTISTTSSVFSNNSEEDYEQSPRNGEEEPMSIDSTTSPPLSSYPYRRHRRFLSESDESASATLTEEEERNNFHMVARMSSRPSCVVLEMDLLSFQNEQRLGDSLLGQIHHELAKYHEMGRFVTPLEAVDAPAALFHEQHAADLGVKEAILTLANIYLGLPHDILATITVSENHDLGMKYMLKAADAGDRGAMIFMAKAYETGNGLPSGSSISYKEAVDWYDRAANMTQEDECGEFDATMDDPVYQLKAAMAQLYMVGGYDLDKDPSYAGELFTDAAERATAAMKGRLANKFYALAEEAWALVEEE